MHGALEKAVLTFAICDLYTWCDQLSIYDHPHVLTTEVLGRKQNLSRLYTHSYSYDYIRKIEKELY